MKAKHHWLDIAETVDSLRVFPRLFLTSCFVWNVQIAYVLVTWYTKLPSSERTLEASGFASVVFLTINGFLKLVFDTYTRGGRDWNGVTTVASTTTTATSVSGPPAGNAPPT